jgi:hypothetical protein
MDDQRAHNLAVRSAALHIFLHENKPGETTEKQVAEQFGEDLAAEVRTFARQYWTLLGYWNGWLAEQSPDELTKDEIADAVKARDAADKLTLM